MPTKAAKPKPKAKVAAKPKPASKPKPDRKQAARLKARRQFRAEQDERREQRPAPVAPVPVAGTGASKGFFYGIIKFFWLLFHPGKTARDFDAQYKK